MHILVTGGAGYIGTHTCLELLRAGYQVTVIDNCCNSSSEAIRRVERLSGARIAFHNMDLRDLDMLRKVFDQGPKVEAVLHFAGLKAVGESVQKPLLYYQNNILSTLNLCQVMEERSISNFVFSSSATVYGDPASVPIREDFPLSCTNPYGRSKWICEEILADMQRGKGWNIALLRYFNPVGADKSGQIGEDPRGIPNNLIPYITQVAIGRQKELLVFGQDYPTPDGTGVRDYIHVTDLALGHVRALEKLQHNPGLVICNLGTGQGYSVLEMVRAFAKASGREIPYRIVARRPGDVAACYADPSFAASFLGWKAERGLAEMCADSWRWQSQNPDGYGDADQGA